MYTFNNNSIFTSYLKGMLREFNLPSYEAWSPNKLLYKDAYYIYKNFIVKSLHTAKYEEFDLNNFKVIQDNYVFGNKLTNITKKLRLDSLYYDSYTHNYLGKYLRFYRDYTGIDLMSLYNCFSESSVTNLTIKDLSQNIILQADEDSTMYMIDIIPGKEYTLYIDCKNLIEIAAGYYDNGYVNINSIELPSTDANIVFPYEKTYFKISNTTFNRPFIYDKLADIEALGISNVETLYHWRDKLKLFIKVPKNLDSSIVILEGNYLKSSEFHFENTNCYLSNWIESKKYVLGDDVDNYTPTTQVNQDITREYLTKSQLTCINGTINYPFSDRLVEYLVSNTIDPQDKIENNVKRVQDILIRKTNPGLKRINISGVWDESLRNVSYGLAKQNNLINTKYDILGYVDKDVEDLLNLKDGD